MNADPYPEVGFELSFEIRLHRLDGAQKFYSGFDGIQAAWAGSFRPNSAMMPSPIKLSICP
jgi:hypothetical protein